MLQLKKVKLIGVSWQCYVLGIYTINQHNKWLFSLVFVGETLWHNRYHESIVFPANLLANVLINKTKRHRKYTTQHNSINLNNRAQWTQWKQAKPDLVIHIQGGPFRGATHWWRSHDIAGWSRYNVHTPTPLCCYGLSTGPTEGLSSWWPSDRSSLYSQQ